MRQAMAGVNNTQWRRQEWYIGGLFTCCNVIVITSFIVYTAANRGRGICNICNRTIKLNDSSKEMMTVITSTVITTMMIPMIPWYSPRHEKKKMNIVRTRGTFKIIYFENIVKKIFTTFYRFINSVETTYIGRQRNYPIFFF